ncbi:hypothetical protein Hs30E_13140 [Lactococcus hodotermopsidis]|uniref:Uncharacterized protein n=1 Tax=Pseudolactococcus hodotermopsidis TaxID=2709157 RepID=A0A6A0BDJ6_9LACT|nr:hypothetical protein [Lactococcus hodotermopsidis]GFH42763.1 hypothetical protein Hs30E_13140 [Lactococcus hodotermopsidis]
MELAKEDKVKEKFATAKEKFLDSFEKLKFDIGKNGDGVFNMKYPNDKGKMSKFNRSKDSTDDLFNVIYQNICNLFHGSKPPFGEVEILSDNDIDLINWVYDTLREIYKVLSN